MRKNMIKLDIQIMSSSMIKLAELVPSFNKFFLINSRVAVH
uniref:Uncharacterized protein n=1 Tax=Arundo donax TaxID=35708 RepID=A0A0A9A2W1_ARUDO